MNVTNSMGFPQAIVNAVSKFQREPNDTLSVTTLLKPMRQVVLERRHWEEMTVDVSDRIWALIGQIGHSILEKGSDGVTEERMFSEELGQKISGQFDLLNGDTLLDYKFTSVWAMLNGVKTEHEQQLNLYHLLAKRNGKPVKEAKIIAIYRDWSVMESYRSQNYPKQQVQIFDVPIWTEERQVNFLRERINAYREAMGELPVCNSVERWEKPTVYALMKPGAKRATKLFDSLAEAQKAVTGGMTVVERPGESTRCRFYCDVGRMGFCDFFNKYVKETND